MSLHQFMAGAQVPLGISSPLRVNAASAAPRMEDVLHENEILRNVLDNFPTGVSLFDRNLRMVFCNRMLRDLLEYPDSLFEFGPPTLEQLFRFNATRGEYGPGKIEDFVAEKLKLVNLRSPHVFERTRPNGTVLEVRGVPIENGGFVTTYIDVTQQRRTAIVDTEHHHLDKLTKLPERDFIEKKLLLALQRMRPEDVACLHCLDLDKFTQVNAQFGHGIGDFVLKEVAMRLLSTIRGYDFLARVGGDRFLVLQSSVRRPSDVTKLAFRMAEEIKKPIMCGAVSVQVTCSVGVALAPRDGREVQSLISKAEANVLKSKSRGGHGAAVTGGEF